MVILVVVIVKHDKINNFFVGGVFPIFSHHCKKPTDKLNSQPDSFTKYEFPVCCLSVVLSITLTEITTVRS